MHNTSLLLLLLFSLSMLVACGPNSAGEENATQSVAEPVVAEVPESGVTQPEFSVWNTAPNAESVSIDGSRVFVTHFGPDLKPTSKDGDGYIAVYDANGTLVDTLITGLHAPKGTVVRGRTLYIADVDRLVGVNTTTGKKTIDIAFPGTSFLNGLTAGQSDLLYISATDIGKVWSVVPRTGEIVELANLPGANGIAYDAASKAVYAVQYLQNDPGNGRIYRIDSKTGEATVQSDYRGLLDGAIVQDGKLYFTDWGSDAGGKILAMDLKTQETRLIAEDTLFAGPANFDVLLDGLALVPMLTGSKVVAVPLR